MVSVLAFYSDDLSLNPAGNLNFLYEKTKINKKGPGLAHLKKTSNTQEYDQRDSAFFAQNVQCAALFLLAYLSCNNFEC